MSLVDNVLCISFEKTPSTVLHFCYPIYASDISMYWFCLLCCCYYLAPCASNELSVFALT